MALRDMRLEKLYAFKTKDLASLRTHDIEGALPQKRTRERKLNREFEEYGYSTTGKAIPGMIGVDNSEGRFKFLKGEDYRPKRNPLHFSDSKLFEENHNVKLRTYFDRNSMKDVRQSMQGPPMYKEYVRDYKDVRRSHQQPLNGIGHYKDTLEQFTEQQEKKEKSVGFIDENQPAGGFNPEETMLKKNYANFYGIDDKGDRDYVYKNVNKGDIVSSQGMPREREEYEKSRMMQDDQTLFTKTAADQNILFKRDLDMFYEGDNENNDTPENFVRNYNEFFRGSTPDENMRRKMHEIESKKGSSKPKFEVDKRTDVYHYNFITHKPKYVYTTESKRLNKKQRHYDKFANDPQFKEACSKFFGVEEEYPKLEFKNRMKGPKNLDELETMSMAYGAKKAFYL